MLFPALIVAVVAVTAAVGLRLSFPVRLHLDSKEIIIQVCDFNLFLSTFHF